MDKRDEMTRIVKEHLPNAVKRGKLYFYPDISDKTKSLVTKFFDININNNNIIAFHDCSVAQNGSKGIVFTLTGVYYSTVFEKPYYFNYLDIDTMEVIPNKKGFDNFNTKLNIFFQNGESLIMSDGYYFKNCILHLLGKLKEQFVIYEDIVCIKPPGEVAKVKLTDSQKVKCNAIIHPASVAAGGVGTGLAQIPLADNVIITPIQIAMITSLGAVFGIRVTEGMAKGILTGFAASLVGRGVVQVLVGWIPGVGNAINTATAAGITEAIGWMAVAHFFDAQQHDLAKGKVNGMKEGYNAASQEYEGKLRRQAFEFIRQHSVHKDEVERYEQLLTEYEEYIADVESRQVENSSAANELVELKKQFDDLRLLTIAD